MGRHLEPYMDRVYNVTASAPSPLLFSGANFDSAITPPPFFREHMLPQIKKRAEMAHSMGKYLICHTDGENHGLMECLLESGMDVADSVCPAPMTRPSFLDYYDSFREKITIWGGISSSIMLQETASDKEFYSFMDDLFVSIGDGKRIILSIADTVPPGARFDRLEHMAKLCREYAPTLE